MKVKRNDHEATQSHAVPDVIKKKKNDFQWKSKTAKYRIENNYQNMLGSTYAEFCTKKLRYLPSNLWPSLDENNF